MHAFVCGLEVQTDLEIKVCHVGVQCDLLCPQDSSPRPESLERNSGPVTSTPIKDSIPVAVTDVDISDVSDLEDDTTTVDATESTAYFESSTSTMESDDSMPAEKQSTYLVFESALLILFSTCFFCIGAHFLPLKSGHKALCCALSKSAANAMVVLLGIVSHILGKFQLEMSLSLLPYFILVAFLQKL